MSTVPSTFSEVQLLLTCKATDGEVAGASSGVSEAHAVIQCVIEHGVSYCWDIQVLGEASPDSLVAHLSEDYV